MLELHTTALSANGRKPLALARHLGLDVQVREVNVYRGEGRAPGYLALNPAGRIPTLVDGALVLTESNAILVYLSEAHGDFALSSREPAQRARIHSWLFWESAHWQPVLSHLLAPAVGHALLPERVPRPTAAPDWEDPQLLPLVERLERALAPHAALVGEDLSLADLSVAGMVTYFRVCGFPFERYPAFRDWYGRIESLDAWRSTGTEPWTRPR